MTALATLAAVAELYATRGRKTYGENVTQIDHALQCAALARAGGATPALVAAALLHDVGHLLHDDAADGDAGHAAAAAAALAELFGPAVCDPIALHVAAKRYLCFAEADYRARLSPASVRSLAAQGGAFDAAAAAVFMARPHAAAAIIIRRFDDSGKRDAAAVAPFDDYLPLLAALVETGAR